MWWRRSRCRLPLKCCTCAQGCPPLLDIYVCLCGNARVCACPPLSPFCLLLSALLRSTLLIAWLCFLVVPVVLSSLSNVSLSSSARLSRRGVRQRGRRQSSIPRASLSPHFPLLGVFSRRGGGGVVFRYASFLFCILSHHNHAEHRLFPFRFRFRFSLVAVERELGSRATAEPNICCFGLRTSYWPLLLWCASALSLLTYLPFSFFC